MIQTPAEGEVIRKMLEAAGDARRFEMLRWLRGRRLTVQELVACTGLAQPLVSHHLATLRDSGLVDVEPDGRRRYHFLATSDPRAAQVLSILAELGERALPKLKPARPPRTRKRRKVRSGSVVPEAAATALPGFLVGDGTDAVAPLAQRESDRLVVSLDDPGAAPRMLTDEEYQRLDGSAEIAPAKPVSSEPQVGSDSKPDVITFEDPLTASQSADGASSAEPRPSESRTDSIPAPSSDSDITLDPDPSPDPLPDPAPEPPPRDDLEDFLL